MRRKIDFIINEENAGKKVFNYLKKEAGFSTRLITSLKHFDDGMQLNGEHTKTIDILKAGDILSVTLPDDDDEEIIEPVEFDIDVVYEDDDIIVVNKPAHLAVHPSHNHQGDTLANAISWHLKNEGKSSVFRAVGRLDKNTSGLVVCALNRFSAAKLNGKVKKEYIAIAEGTIINDGRIDAPIYRPDPIITLRTVDERGDKAITNYEVLKNWNNMTLLRITLETGRTHQIRVHLSHLGFPLLGDTMYGKESGIIDRHALHCDKVEFIHPVTNDLMTFSVELPEDMKNIIE